MDISTIYCGSDHAGLSLKKVCMQFIKSQGWVCQDLGTNSPTSCDYPVYAAKVCREVRESRQFGLLICGTGLGMSMTANRFFAIRAALCTNEYTARMSRKHNNANILCLGARVVGEDLALSMLDVFMRTVYDQGRHQKRVELIDTVGT